MVITRLTGGLGNQLWQYAVARGLAHKLQTEMKLDLNEFNASYYRNSHHNYYRLNAFNIQENFATPEELQSVNEKTWKIFSGTRSSMPDSKYRQMLEDAEKLNSNDNIFIQRSDVLYGIKYFSDISDIIRHEFTLKNPLHEKSEYWKQKIIESDCSVSIHIRHGDYLLPVYRIKRDYVKMLPLEYYHTCIQELKKYYSNITAFVFSDDLEWAKKDFKLDIPVEFVEGCELDIEEFYLISLCKHNINVISTFSWWSSWLNNNPDKKVFSPKKFDKENPENNIILQEGFITKIPVDYDRNPHIQFPHLLSIILYVENNIGTINYAISGILSQNFQDYEVIILDASNDNSGEIFRRFLSNKNFKILKENSSTGKFSAWNKGLDCAHGEYVLFMTGNDIIFQNAVNEISNVWTNFYDRKSNSRQNYLTFANYNKFIPNIICSTQRIEEDINGNLMINNIKNKKFLVKVDARFKELKDITEFKISDRDKMIFLATQQINNLLGTKFFKRTFLNEHKIRFDETLKGEGTELKFLTDAFMHTENITFTPQLFYGTLN